MEYTEFIKMDHWIKMKWDESWNILEKMEQWNMVEDILNDSHRYLNYVDDKLRASDTSLRNELDILNKILSKVETDLKKLRNERQNDVRTYLDAKDEIHKVPGHCNDKLKQVLNEQSQLTGLKEKEKKGILKAWEEASKYHWGCSLNLKPMKECIKKNCPILAKCGAKIGEYFYTIRSLVLVRNRTRKTIQSVENFFPKQPSYEKDDTVDEKKTNKRETNEKDDTVDEKKTNKRVDEKKAKKKKDRRVITSSTHAEKAKSTASL